MEYVANVTTQKQKNREIRWIQNALYCLQVPQEIDINNGQYYDQFGLSYCFAFQGFGANPQKGPPMAKRASQKSGAKNTTSAVPGDGAGIVVKSVGLRWFHPGGFVVDRPNGLPDWTFVQWLTPTVVKIGDASRVEPAGGCLFYRPGDPHWYGSDIFTPFGNNWFHFNGPAVAGIMTECGIPLNQPIQLRNDDFIETSIRTFLRESMSERSGRHYALSAHALLFLVEFGRMLSGVKAATHSARNLELREKFDLFRERLREQCAEAWTLGRMAGELHLSPSRFSNLYRQFYDAKPVDDLIRMRLELAGYYLRGTTMSVNYIANLCGFTDIYYFSRMFKAKMGVTASVFRAGAEE